MLQLVFTAKDYIYNKTLSNTLHYPKSKLHFHMPGNSKSLQEELVEPQLDNRV